MWLASVPLLAEPYLVRPVSARATYLGDLLSMNDAVFLVPVVERDILEVLQNAHTKNKTGKK